MTRPLKRRKGKGQHCHCKTSLMHVRPLCRKASVGPTTASDTANLKNGLSHMNATTVDFPMLHGTVAVLHYCVAVAHVTLLIKIYTFCQVIGEVTFFLDFVLKMSGTGHCGYRSWTGNRARGQ